MPLWGKNNQANNAPKFTTSANTGFTGIQDYGNNVIFVTGSEGYPVGPGWAKKTIGTGGRSGRTFYESLVSLPTVYSAVPLIGGIAIGSAGAVGGVYEGYVLSGGDDFNTLDILGPVNPRGKWWTTRTYLAGARGSDTSLGTMYDTDPLMTGHNDSNRGVPVGFNNMSVSASEINLQARKATTQEQAFMSSTRNEVAAMLSGAGAIHWYPSTAGTGDIIVEARMKVTSAATNPVGFHPSFWMQSLNPTIAINSDEWDWEGSSQGAYFNNNTWTSGTATTTNYGSVSPHDGQYHNIRFVLNTTSAKMYVDDVLFATANINANSKSKPQYPILSSHILNSTYNGDTYSQAAWNADADGATLSFDWIRIWRRSGTAHFKPLVSVPDTNVDYGATATITLPSVLSIWGDASVTEYLQVVYNEENEPGVTHSTVFSQFPTGVSYNSGTRQITVNITSGNSGRMNFVLAAWKTNGSTGEPLRFAVNVGPNITTSAVNFTVGQPVSFDLYSFCDCGVLTTNGVSRAKTITVTGLSGSGLSYSDTTGLVTGNPLVGSFTAHVVVTNSLGQQASGNIAITNAAAPTYNYMSWNGPLWIDASDTSTITATGNVVSLVSNKRTGVSDLTKAGTANITTVASGQNGKNILRFAVNTTSPGRLQTATANSTIDTMQQGNDKPYVMIAVYKPTDANTGFISGWSDTVPTADAQQIGLIRRASSASSVRRSTTVSVSNDVSWGSGQASGSPRIVAISHTGTAVSIWDTSLTKAVNAAAQDANPFNTELLFYIGAAETSGASDPSFAPSVCAMDFMECILETSRTDTEIQQAITDLSTKWGITLT